MSALHAGAGAGFGGALTTLLAEALAGHFHLDPGLATADAGLLVAGLGGAWALAVWFVSWRYPAAPPLPVLAVVPPPTNEGHPP